MFWPFTLFRSSDEKNKKVILPVGWLEIDLHRVGSPVVPKPELAEWLSEYRGQYRFRYNELNGERWIQFDDPKIGVMCKVTFG